MSKSVFFAQDFFANNGLLFSSVQLQRNTLELQKIISISITLIHLEMCTRQQRDSGVCNNFPFFPSLCEVNWICNCSYQTVDTQTDVNQHSYIATLKGSNITTAQYAGLCIVAHQSHTSFPFFHLVHVCRRDGVLPHCVQLYWGSGVCCMCYGGA